MTRSGGMESLKQASSNVAGEAATEVRERQGIRQTAVHYALSFDDTLLRTLWA